MSKIITNESQKLTCLICYRDRFKKPGPHRCGNVYRKRHLKWGFKVSNGIWRTKYKNKQR